MRFCPCFSKTKAPFTLFLTLLTRGPPKKKQIGKIFRVLRKDYITPRLIQKLSFPLISKSPARAQITSSWRRNRGSKQQQAEQQAATAAAGASVARLGLAQHAGTGTRKAGVGSCAPRRGRARRAVASRLRLVRSHGRGSTRRHQARGAGRSSRRPCLFPHLPSRCRGPASCRCTPWPPLGALAAGCLVLPLSEAVGRAATALVADHPRTALHHATPPRPAAG